MDIKEIDTKVLAEMYVLFSNLSREYQEKIPENVIRNIEKYRNKEYQYDLQAELLPETKALLVVMIKEYFGNDDFNKKLQMYTNYYYFKTEEEKSQKFTNQEIFETKPENTKKKQMLVIKDEKWYEKIVTFVKKFFRK